MVKIYETIILPSVLYGCETWSLTLREEHRLRVFENRVLWRIFGPKRDEGIGEWRKLLHNFYSSTDIIMHIKSRRMRWVRHVEHVGEERKLYSVLIAKPEGKRPLGRLKHRCENVIKLDLNGDWRVGGEWIESTQDRDRWWALVKTVMNLWVLVPRG
jgi:hypothetical protein